MAIAFIGSTNGSSSAGGNITLTLPGSPVAGDVAIVAVTLGTSRTTTLSVASSSGGTSFYTQIVATIASSNVRFGVFRAVIPSTITLTQAVVTGSAGSTDSTTTVVHIFRGVEQSTNPEDVTPTSTTGSATNPNSPSLTPVSCSDAYLTSVGAGTLTALTAPTSWLNATNSTGSGTNVAQTAQAWITNATTAALDPAAWTGATPSWCSATIALHPAITFTGALLLAPDISSQIDEQRRVIVRSY